MTDKQRISKFMSSDDHAGLDNGLITVRFIVRSLVARSCGLCVEINIYKLDILASIVATTVKRAD